MKLNENCAISTDQVLLVPYDPHHVLTYHGWMADPAIQEATASEPLTLEEEYENQQSWRASHDKLTFIVCLPLSEGALSHDDDTTTTTTTTTATADSTSLDGPGGTAPLLVRAGQDDAPARMVGDVNLFLYPYEPEDAADSLAAPLPAAPELVVGEVDVMIADPRHRQRGLGRGAVRALVRYVLRHAGEVAREYASDKDYPAGKAPGLKMLMVKIKEGNQGSLRLFGRLGFEQEGEVNYFGELTLVNRELEELGKDCPEGYREGVYLRNDGAEGAAAAAART
ncbi:hypothetical protein VTJ83DRAFT_3463 [Remersonia thermophila]|uniref:N-acetyltransferase domain-containing protein n=1 Tax=Remersonia thermophila TaxID=72144 RepID=A0ABR4DED6_9PEZI